MSLTTADIYDLIRDIKDPEFNETLEELKVVKENLVRVIFCEKTQTLFINVEITPTVPHCTLASLIGLCIRTKLNRELDSYSYKLDIAIEEGSHNSSQEITKQINDKERVAAALENLELLQSVEECINYAQI